MHLVNSNLSDLTYDSDNDNYVCVLYGRFEGEKATLLCIIFR